MNNDLPAFLLVRSVTQPQDRTLLPSEAEWGTAAARGAEDWFALELQKLTGGSAA